MADSGRSPQAGRAGRATHRARAGLGHPATIPNATRDLITGREVEPWALHFLNKRRERVARALSIPQHHTTWELLSETEKDLFYMQADYAIKAMGGEEPAPEWTTLHEAIAQGLMGAYGEDLAPCELAYRIVTAASGIETRRAVDAEGGVVAKR